MLLLEERNFSSFSKKNKRIINNSINKSEIAGILLNNNKYSLTAVFIVEINYDILKKADIKIKTIIWKI